jgi:hypothetical protein
VVVDRALVRISARLGNVTRRVADWPCESNLVVGPLMLKSWRNEAVFVTLKITTPRFAVFALRMKMELWAATLIVVRDHPGERKVPRALYADHDSACGLVVQGLTFRIP